MALSVQVSLGAASLAITADQRPGAKAVAGVDGKIDEDNDDHSAANKQETEWAAGVSFGIGSTNLGIGMDSKKLMQTSIGADLGAFSGSLFYAQQKDKTIKVGTEASTAANTVNNKKTGMGAEIKVSAGANTTINAVYTQGKNTDIRKANEAGDAIHGEDGQVAATAIAKTDKGFGVGVSHNLGGGATLEAGFAKVKKQTKASVGVSMSF